MENNKYLYEENIYDNIQNIAISTYSNNIIIKEHTENFIKICYDKESNSDLKITLNNDTLKLEQKSKFGKNFLKLLTKYNGIYIYLPNKMFNLFLLEINGNIECYAKKLKNIKIMNINGNIYTEIQKAKSLEINNVNGNVILNFNYNNSLTSKEDIHSNTDKHISINCISGTSSLNFK